MNFVEAQAQYYAQCHAYMTELQKQLARYNLAHFIFQYLTAEYPATRSEFCVAGYAVRSEWYMQGRKLS